MRMDEVEYEFVVSDGQGGTRAIVFPSRRFLVGAGPECEVRFDGFGLLPTHAEVLLDQRGEPWVGDLTGEGLVWVNSVATARSLIPSGAMVRLGDLELGVRHRTAVQFAKTARARPSLGLLQPGTVIEERYRVVQKLATGGMGEVYQVEHIQLGKAMAIKVMRPELSRAPDFVARFKREAIAASRIGHLNIVDISDFGQTEDGHFYFVMEYLDGETLADILRREAMPVKRAVAVSLQVAQALASAHAQGVVHRDLKPENVMLLQIPRQPDFVKVLDFGAAKVATGPGERGHTAVGMVMGTPQYMPPEQAKGLTIDGRTDIYALGLILYELLTGRPAFTGQTMSVLLVKQMTEPPPPLDPGPVGEVPGELEELIFWMLEKAPEARPQTMDEVVKRLDSLDAKLRAGVVLRPGSRTMTTPSRPRAETNVTGGNEETPVGDTPTSYLPKTTGKTHGPLRRWLTLGMIALGGGGAGVYLWPSPPPLPPAEREAEATEPLPPPPPRPPPIEARPPTTPVQAPVQERERVQERVPAPTVTKRVSSRPSRAEVYLNGTLLGRTPLDVTEEADKEVVLRLVLARHQDATKTVTFRSSDRLVVELKPKPLAAPPRPPSPLPPDDDRVIIDRPRSR